MDGRPGDTPVLTRTGSAGPGPGLVVALVAGGILVALAKPWGGPPPDVAAMAVPPAHAPAVVPTGSSPGQPLAGDGSTPRSAPSTPSPDELVAADCLTPSAWRVFTAERWRSGPVRSWIAVVPVTASGPADPRIPLVPVVAVAVTGLGYCAPVGGPDRPAERGPVSAWRLDGGPPRLLTLAALRPERPSILGALYGPPPAATDARHSLSSFSHEPPTGWAADRYVFDVDGRWFGVAVRLQDDP